MTDWNHDNKEDWKDAYIYHEIINKTEKNSYRKNSGSSLFKIVVGICTGLVILSLLLGVEVPGVVITFFLKIILIVGFMTLFTRK